MMLAAPEEIGGLGVQEVARRLGVSEQTLRRRIWRGEVKASRSRWGRSYRWLVSLDGWSSSSEHPESQAPDPTTGTPPIPDYAPDHDNASGQADALAWDDDNPTFAPRRQRLAETEALIEAEIGQLAVHASEVQLEIERLKRGLSALRAS